MDPKSKKELAETNGLPGLLKIIFTENPSPHRINRLLKTWGNKRHFKSLTDKRTKKLTKK